ncbi:histone-lysine N-methyltransferase SETMAR-like [Lepeophtheirus salmonis]|uniref:histone-lysine N-methyltransferase SETMAR-like n=1 Tax=Lepeophtheirus salmonis TaxID=72036 RepID=UPI001AE45DFC|nr:histone-lysine N-methyltransferase SETMAR-like [Lepeophtheirus salmonis]
MDTSKEKISHILQFYFDKGENATQAAENVNSVYGPDTITDNDAQFWYIRFYSGIFDVKDVARSGRRIVENVDRIMGIVESDRHVATVSIAEELNMLQKTVCNHLNKAGYKKKLGVWVPHELTEKNLIDRISACESLINRNKIDPFLQRMVISDEKWVTYDNIKRKRLWLKRGEPEQTLAKPGLTARKALLCVWWDWEGIIHFELLPYDLTLNSDLYCEQLDRLKESIAQKRPALASSIRIVFHQDNTRPHASIETRQKIRELGWEVLLHPPYSPDLAPSDYHLFPSIANDFAGEKFTSIEACENRLSEFFTNMDKGFYERGIMELPSKWLQVIEQNGAYLM